MSLEVITVLYKTAHLYTITVFSKALLSLFQTWHCYVTCTKWSKVVQIQLFKTSSSL